MSFLTSTMASSMRRLRVTAILVAGLCCTLWSTARASGGLSSPSFRIPMLVINSGGFNPGPPPGYCESHGHIGELGGLVHQSPSFRLYPGLSGQLEHCGVEPVSTVPDLPEPVITALLAAFPNPLNGGGGLTIRFSLAKDMNASIQVFDITGSLVRQVLSGQTPAGLHQVTWDGLDAGGQPVGSGIYFYRLVAGPREFTKKLIVLTTGR